MSAEHNSSLHTSAGLIIAVAIYVGYVWLGESPCERTQRIATPISAMTWLVAKIEGMFSDTQSSQYTADWQNYRLSVIEFAYRVQKGDPSQCKWIDQQRAALNKSKDSEDEIIEDLQRRIVGSGT